MITKIFFNSSGKGFPQTPQYLLLNGFRSDDKALVETLHCQAIQRINTTHTITEIVTLAEVRFYSTRTKTSCCVWLTYPDNHHACSGASCRDNWYLDRPAIYQKAIEALGITFLEPVYDLEEIKDSLIQLAYLLAQLDQKYTYSHYTIVHSHA